MEHFDLEGNLLEIGDRVVSMDRVNGHQIRPGTVTGFTAKQTKVIFDHDPKEYGKQNNTVAKIFRQYAGNL